MSDNSLHESGLLTGLSQEHQGVHNDVQSSRKRSRDGTILSDPARLARSPPTTYLPTTMRNSLLQPPETSAYFSLSQKLSSMSEDDFLFSAIQALNAQQRAIVTFTETIKQHQRRSDEGFSAIRNDVAAVRQVIKGERRSAEDSEAAVLLDGRAGGLYPAAAEGQPMSLLPGFPIDLRDALALKGGRQPCSRLSSPSTDGNRSGSPEIIEIDGEQPLNWDSISQLNSDVESVPPSTLWGSAPPSPSRDASYTEVRYVRGRSKLLAPTYLPVSDRSRGSVKWPKKSKNTERGRLQEISCDKCKARVHWACASLEDHHDLQSEPWYCPDCEYALQEEGEAGIEVAQQDRCNRPDCILRSHIRMKGSGHGDNFVLERIVGRKLVDRDTKYRRVYMYLIKWENYPVYDYTWEPAKHIPSLAEQESRFLIQCENQGVDPRDKVALLPEVTRCFNEKGLRRRRMLIEEGVDPAEWWEGDDDPEE